MHVKHPDEVEFSADVSTVGQLGLEQFEPFFLIFQCAMQSKIKETETSTEARALRFFFVPQDLQGPQVSRGHVVTGGRRGAKNAMCA